MYKFSKKERLCSNSDIERLFEENNYFIHEKIKVYWNFILSEENNIEVLFSVPKKITPKAVNRNKIKRLIKESFRKNKNLIKNKNKLQLAFVYLSPEIPNFNSLEEKIKVILQRLNNQL